MKPQSAKNKGRILQQHVRDCIYKAFSRLREGDCESTSMGAGGVDIKLSPLARELFPWSVECKSKKAYAVYKDMEQAESNMLKGTRPLVVIKQNRSKPMAVLYLEDFMKFYSEKK